MSSHDTFGTAFVAMSYLLGRRMELTQGLSEPSAAARSLADALVREERTDRAELLSDGLVPLVRALDARRLT